jgi:hypothetical protein
MGSARELASLKTVRQASPCRCQGCQPILARPVWHSTGWFSSVTDLGWCCYRWVGYNFTNKCRVEHGVQAGKHGGQGAFPWMSGLCCSPEMVCAAACAGCVCGWCWHVQHMAWFVGLADCLCYAMVWHAGSHREGWVAKGRVGPAALLL